MLKSFWQITRKSNGNENPSVLKVWLYEFEELVRDFHDKNYNYSRYPTTTPDGILLSKKKRSVMGMPYPNTLFTAGMNNGYPSGIKANYDKIIAKQTEFKLYKARVEKFKGYIDGTVYKPPTVPDVTFPGIIVGYKFDVINKSYSYKLLDINVENATPQEIQLTSFAYTGASILIPIIKKYDESKKSFDAINKKTAVFLTNITTNLYIYYALCTLYGIKVDEKRKAINKKLVEINSYIARQTGRLIPFYRAFETQVNQLKGKTPPTEVNYAESANDMLLLEFKDVKKLIKSAIDDYSNLMQEFHVKYKDLLNRFVESLTDVEGIIDSIVTLVTYMKTTMETYQYVIKKNDQVNSTQRQDL